MMIKKFKDNIVPESYTIKQAMETLNSLESKENLTLFIVSEKGKLVGTVTDGDIRRGLLSGIKITDSLSGVIHRDFKYLRQNFGLTEIDQLKKKGIGLVPLLNDQDEIIKIVLLREQESLLPVDGFMLAGGEGRRLLPLTADTPKPMLPVGDKPIIEYNIDRLRSFGIDNVFIAVNYLADKIRDFLGDGAWKGISIRYVHENTPLGTIGAISMVNQFIHDTVLVMNSDLLTNIDLEDFYRVFMNSGADMAVAGVPYKVEVPYAIMEVDKEKVISFREKPTYTYYSNAGIYLIKRELLNMVPAGKMFNATDLMEEVLKKKKHLIYYPILGYWLDIGQHEDYKKAQEDIRHIKL